MKLISKILAISIIVPLFLVGCSDVFDVNSDKYVTDTEYEMKNPNDTLYSMFGIYAKLQKLADRYVLLGELRADLLDVDQTSTVALQEINNFNVSAGNKYANIRDYYAVINNCNYVIQNIDTSYVKKASKVLLKEYVAAKSIRAWTYMQIALNFGSATFYEEPILSTTDANKQYPEYDIYQLADALIKDLEPYKDVDFPSYGTLGAFNSKYSFFPIRFLLGDLYLWKGDYLSAAQNYHDLMMKGSYIVTSTYSATWTVTGNTFVSSSNRWITLIMPNSSETITEICSSNSHEHVYDLDSINSKFMIKPTTKALQNWNNQNYFDSYNATTPGDLRKDGSVYQFQYNTITNGVTTANTKNIIYKYWFAQLDSASYSTKIYRSSLLYLRYAEAVNRLGKPNLAFAVIKNGLNLTNMANPKIIPAREAKAPLPSYMNFSDSRFTNNVGIRMRGLGKVDKDTTYVIPAFKNGNLQDSITYVEDLIQQELALETAFEGNRFQDLMRFAIRRDDNAYLADKIAAKHVGNESGFKALLLNRANWYLKK
jgi:hypothetical protein